MGASSKVKEIVTPGGRVSLGADDIIRIVVNDGAKIEARDIRAFLDARVELAPHRVPVLIDQRRIGNMTREAQEESTRGAESRPTYCVAILVEGPISVMVANFFIIFGRPHYPTRLFTNEPAALEWIENMRRKHRDG